MKGGDDAERMREILMNVNKGNSVQIGVEDNQGSTDRIQCSRRLKWRRSELPFNTKRRYDIYLPQLDSSCT